MVPVEWGVAEKIPKNVEGTLEMVKGRGWNSLEASEEDRKKWESLEPPRNLLNGFDKNVDSDMNNKVQVRFSDGNNELVRTGEKVTLVTFEQRLVVFCHCLRDLRNFELERDDLGYVAEEISKQQTFKR